MEEIIKDTPYLKVDSGKIEVWEVLAFEADPPRVTDLLLVFAKYVAINSELVSPELPSIPLDELTDEQLKQIKTSEGYRQLKHFSLPSLFEAAKSFANQATGDLSPN